MFEEILRLWSTLEKTLQGILIGSLLTLSGVILTSLVNWVNVGRQLKHQALLERNKRRLEKLEDLHKAVSDYILVVTDLAFEVNFRKDENNLKEYERLSREIRGSSYNVDRLVRLYAPNSIRTLVDIRNAEAELLEATLNYITGAADANANIAVINKLVGKCNELQNAIDSESRDLTGIRLDVVRMTQTRK